VIRHGGVSSRRIKVAFATPFNSRVRAPIVIDR
jgi:hypothetical protein